MRHFIRALVLIAVASSGSGIAQQPARSPRQEPPRGVRLEALTWPDAEPLQTPDTVVVIPLGAGSKEHGPHLKLGNDLALAEHLARRVVDAADVVVAPAVTYHFYPAFLEYPGSTSLALETARALMVDIVNSLARYGPRRFYVLNTGISTVRPLDAAAKTLAANGILLRYTDLNARLEPTASKLRQQEGGSHADEIETSMMLYLDRGSVDMKRAVKDLAPAVTPFRLTRQRNAAATYSPSGVWGDPTLATPEKGEALVEALVSGILQDIESIRRASPPAGTASAHEAATAPRRGAGAGSETRSASGCTAGDERTIRQLGDAYALHWANADAVRLAELWTDKGDMIHPDGAIERTREVIMTNRAHMFSQREYRGSRHSLSLMMIRCLSADYAVADGRWELRNVTDTTKKGSMLSYEGQATLVVSRAGGGWQIDAYRYTLKPSPAPMPTLLKRPGWPDKQGGV